MNLTFADRIAPPDGYLPPAPAERGWRGWEGVGRTTVTHLSPNVHDKLDRVIEYVRARGFVFEPWQVAAFVAAARTKPFVILAGISGTGKTKLPRLIAEATGADALIVPVRADWTDSSDLLGYERIDGQFQPGVLLRYARRACEDPDRQFFFVLDEMNIARVEYYLAEVLSLLEERAPDENGRVMSHPLRPDAPGRDGWNEVRLPQNLCIVGSVNMDETTHGFSRKVLDRSFVIEFSTVDLAAVGDAVDPPEAQSWASTYWRAAALTLAEHPSRHNGEVGEIIRTLVTLNEALKPGQLQVGYRVRDEIVMFCLAAQQTPLAFATTEAGTVDPLDLAVAMKILPRIQGGGRIIRGILETLRTWAGPETPGDGSPATGFPFCGERIEIMIQRLNEAGFASYWL